MEIKKILSNLKNTVKKAPPKLRKIGGIGLIVLLVAVVTLFTLKKISYLNEKHHLEAEAKAGPKVRIAPVTRSDGEHITMTTGEATPYTTVTLYAKVSGYLGTIIVDKGMRVKKGDLLATIESPETDQDYLGARTDFINRDDVAKRMQMLIQKDLIAPQEYEQARSDADMARSRYLAAKTLKGYEELRAPFDGTVTARYVDPGALIQSATSGQTGALPVVTISQIDVLRTYVYLDQRDANFIKVGYPVKVTLAERPGFELPAKIDRIAGELDPKTRMMLVEIDIDNSKNEIVAGSFVAVAIPIHAPSQLEVSVDALVNLNNKTMVPVVQGDNTIKYKEIVIGGNDGRNVAILAGVEEGESLALNLGANVQDGAKVRPIVPGQQAQEDKDGKKKKDGDNSANKKEETSADKKQDGSGQKSGEGSTAPAATPQMITTGGAMPVGDAYPVPKPGQEQQKSKNIISAEQTAGGVPIVPPNPEAPPKQSSSGPQ